MNISNDPEYQDILVLRNRLHKNRSRQQEILIELSERLADGRLFEDLDEQIGYLLLGYLSMLIPYADNPTELSALGLQVHSIIVRRLSQ